MRTTTLLYERMGKLGMQALLASENQPRRFTTTSTRRFFARPSGSSEPSGFVFGAIGFVLPQPRARTRAASVAVWDTNHSDTAPARLSERL